MATLSKWIKDYCELYDITMPSGIEDDETAIMFLKLNKSNGGGGSSDFEIVEVKFVRGTVSGDVEIIVPCVVHWDYSNIDVGTGSTNLQLGDDEKTANVILYKGYAYAFANDGEAILVGDNFDADNEVIIGAGTITINAGEV